MASEVLMPALSPTMTEGKIARWVKSEGDEVRAGDVLAEIETDKATMEVEAVDEGVLAKIVIPEGTEHVAVNTPIALIANNGEDIHELEAKAKAPPAKSEREWVALIESLRSDVERLRTERAEKTEKPAARKDPPPAPRAVRPVKAPRPIQDEWGFFDPQQCGFAALLAKLDEVTDAEDSSVQVVNR